LIGWQWRAIVSPTISAHDPIKLASLNPCFAKTGSIRGVTKSPKGDAHCPFLPLRVSVTGAASSKVTLMSAIVDSRRPKTKGLARRLLAWWDVHRRTLPWRAEPGETPDPYAVWLSEILLQQTTVATVTPYFRRFMARWPRIEDLAAAPIEEVMRTFAGLGYYSRARNLHLCAQEIARRGGVFPDDEASLRKLPGVGAYTAAAIAAIAFNRVASPVDGNIARIVTRLRAISLPIARSRNEIAREAAALTPKDRPGDFAQALMDLGATICTPRSPNCSLCPLAEDCVAFNTDDPETYPRKSIKAPRPLRKGAAFFLRRPDGAILMRTRPAKGLLGGTVELPGTAWTIDFDADKAEAQAPVKANWRRLPGFVEQAFTHFTLQLAVYSARTKNERLALLDCHWVSAEDVGNAGLSGVMSKVVAYGLRCEETPL
jgi:A/G-specific adenine glycosylase